MSFTPHQQALMVMGQRMPAVEAALKAERENVRVLRSAMNLIIDYAGSLDSALIMCDMALATTAPEPRR